MSDDQPKTPEELRRAHALLSTFLTSDDPRLEQLRNALASQGWPQLAQVQLQVLCWLLGHDNGVGFQAKLDKLSKWLTDLGFKHEIEADQGLSIGWSLLTDEEADRLLKQMSTSHMHTPGGVL